MRVSLSAAPGNEYHAGRFGSELLRRRPPSSAIVFKVLSGGGGSNWRMLVAEGVRRIRTLGLESLSFRETTGLCIKSRACRATLAKGAVRGPAADEDDEEASTGTFSTPTSLLSAESLLDRKRRISNCCRRI